MLFISKKLYPCKRNGEYGIFIPSNVIGEKEVLLPLDESVKRHLHGTERHLSLSLESETPKIIKKTDGRRLMLLCESNNHRILVPKGQEVKQHFKKYFEAKNTSKVRIFEVKEGDIFEVTAGRRDSKYYVVKKDDVVEYSSLKEMAHKEERLNSNLFYKGERNLDSWKTI